MPPNARPRDDEFFLDEDPFRGAGGLLADGETILLNRQADTKGLSSTNEAEDRTDVQHSKRKKRDRVLPDGVLIELMTKSDYEGFKRLTINLTIMAATAVAVGRCRVKPSSSLAEWLAFAPLYVFYGFQFQCFAFAGQHEFLHRSAFKTKWVNDVCLFLTSVFCFEMGAHEQLMHKQHHTFTNNIDRDPELTSYYTRAELERPGFRNVPLTRWAYFRQFFDIVSTFKARLGRVVFSAMGVPVDYSGTGWSLTEWTHEEPTMRHLQRWAVAQLSCQAIIVTMFSNNLQALLFWWIVPVLIGYPAVNFFRNLEHADCELSTDVPNCLRNTRSVRSNPIVRTLLWDTNFHAEHHTYPMVPFYNLHKLNALLDQHVIHNEIDHFTTQNWAAVMPGGWIDQQTQRFREESASAASAATQLIEKKNE